MKDLFLADYFRDLVTLIRNNGDVDAFISRIEDAERADFLTNDKYLNDSNKRIQEQKTDLDKVQKEIDVLKRQKELVAELQNITMSCPPGRERDLGWFLREYVGDWRLDTRRYKRLTAAPKGLINLIRNGGRVREWSDRLFEFLYRCDKAGNNDILNDVVHRLSDFTVVEYKALAKALGMSHGSRILYQRQVQEFLQSERERHDKTIADYDSNDVNISKHAARRKVRRNEIANLAKYIKNRDTLNVSDYVKMLDKIDDAEPVMFNIGTTIYNANGDDRVLNNIMWLRGLQTGVATDAWYIHASKHDYNNLEIFSPLMSAGDAKEILPLLLRDLDTLNIRIGLVVPIMGRDLPKKVTQTNEQIDTDEFSRLIQVAKHQTVIAEYKAKGILEAKKDIVIQRIQEIGFKSIEDLMAVPIYKSEGELIAKYPSDKYLFSGTAVSDDYFSFSRRARRSGLIYSTPNPEYAAGYSCARYAGKSPTNDTYISTSVGQTTDGNDIHVGFVNVYAQSPDDEFYRNFDIEDISGHDGYKKISNVQEALRLGDGETFVTRTKNPLAEKIVHIVVHFRDKPTYKPSEYYVPISVFSEKTRNALLQTRQARIEITYPHDPMIARLYAQRDEFDNGIVHKMPRPAKQQPVSNASFDMHALKDIQQQNA